MNSQLTCMSSCEQPLVGDGGGGVQILSRGKSKNTNHLRR